MSAGFSPSFELGPKCGDGFVSAILSMHLGSIWHFLALSARLFDKVPIILEIVDVVSFQVNCGWSGRCFRVLDKNLASTPGFRYLGQYKSPKALSSLYGEVDVICGLAIPRSVPRIRICTGRGRIVSTKVVWFVCRSFLAMVHAMPSMSRITKSVMLSTRSRFRMRLMISQKISRATTSRSGRKTCALFRCASISTRRNSTISRRR